MSCSINCFEGCSFPAKDQIFGSIGAASTAALIISGVIAPQVFSAFGLYLATVGAVGAMGFIAFRIDNIGQFKEATQAILSLPINKSWALLLSGPKACTNDMTYLAEKLAEKIFRLHSQHDSNGHKLLSLNNLNAWKIDVLLSEFNRRASTDEKLFLLGFILLKAFGKEPLDDDCYAKIGSALMSLITVPSNGEPFELTPSNLAIASIVRELIKRCPKLDKDMNLQKALLPFNTEGFCDKGEIDAAFQEDESWDISKETQRVESSLLYLTLEIKQWRQACNAFDKRHQALLEGKEEIFTDLKDFKEAVNGYIKEPHVESESKNRINQLMRDLEAKLSKYELVDRLKGSFTIISKTPIKKHFESVSELAGDKLGPLERVVAGLSKAFDESPLPPNEVERIALGLLTLVSWKKSSTRDLFALSDLDWAIAGIVEELIRKYPSQKLKLLSMFYPANTTLQEWKKEVDAFMKISQPNISSDVASLKAQINLFANGQNNCQFELQIESQISTINKRIENFNWRMKIS